MRLRPQHVPFLLVLVFVLGTLAVFVIATRFTRGHPPPDWRRELARQLGIDSASTASLRMEFPPRGTRSPGSVLASDTHSLVHLGTPDNRVIRRVGWGTVRIALSSFRDASGRVAIPYLSSVVEGKDDYAIEVELDSAVIIEISRQDLRSYASRSELSTLPEADSALLIERVLEARVRLIVARRDHASRGVWVRDSADITKRLNRSGGWLVLKGGSRDNLRFQTPERVVIAFATLPLSKVAGSSSKESNPPEYAAREARASTEHPKARTEQPRDLIAKSESVTIHVFIDPPHALLRINGDLRGPGNRSVTLPRGRHVFEASSPGYAPATEQVEITPGMTIALELKSH